MPKPASSDRPIENPTTKLKEESHQTTGAHNNLNRQTPIFQSNPINKTRPKRDPKEDNFSLWFQGFLSRGEKQNKTRPPKCLNLLSFPKTTTAMNKTTQEETNHIWQSITIERKARVLRRFFSGIEKWKEGCWWECDWGQKKEGFGKKSYMFEAPEEIVHVRGATTDFLSWRLCPRSCFFSSLFARSPRNLSFQSIALYWRKASVLEIAHGSGPHPHTCVRSQPSDGFSWLMVTRALIIWCSDPLFIIRFGFLFRF